MDVFDRYLFDEIVAEYNRTDLSSEDYEEIYQRFLNLEHVPEVKPYLFVMRFLGLGTKAEEDDVLTELRGYLSSNDAVLCGLYYDLFLIKNRDDIESKNALLYFVKRGYSNVYLKKYSSINYRISTDGKKNSGKVPVQVEYFNVGRKFVDLLDSIDLEEERYIYYRIPKSL